MRLTAHPGVFALFREHAYCVYEPHRVCRQGGPVSREGAVRGAASFHEQRRYGYESRRRPSDEQGDDHGDRRESDARQQSARDETDL